MDWRIVDVLKLVSNWKGLREVNGGEVLFSMNGFSPWQSVVSSSVVVGCRKNPFCSSPTVAVLVKGFSLSGAKVSLNGLMRKGLLDIVEGRNW